MKAIENKLEVKKTARYFTLGSPSQKIKNIWFVLHGYGNNAGSFINYFDVLNNGENYIIAAEALNKFYLKGFSGKVGAAWMTKENREDEISDYINFLDSVYKNETTIFDHNKITVNVLGFSQGCPTAVRWLEYGKSKTNNLILWGGTLPHDSDPISLKSVLNNTKLYLVKGDNDRFINNEKLTEEIEKLKLLGINYKQYDFIGGHEINKETLSKISSDLTLNNQTGQCV